MVLSPAVRLSNVNTALPSLISDVYVLPSMARVMFPVAPSGTFTVIVFVSPTLLFSTSTVIGVSSLGAVTLA